jgi:hypothetical protein
VMKINKWIFGLFSLYLYVHLFILTAKYIALTQTQTLAQGIPKFRTKYNKQSLEFY